MKRLITRSKESGAVSLFIVMFSALLITIITVAFVRIMVQEQQQATTNDLSKSALDSAYAGVEDAKRAIVKYRTECSGTNANDPACVNLLSALNAGQCDTLQAAGISGKPGAPEVAVQQQPNNANDPDLKLDQAYTCVKIKLDTQDYVANITSGASRLIHLKSTDTNPFTQIKLEWYSQQDLQTAQGTADSSGSGSTDASKVNLYGQDDSDTQVPPSLPKLKDWPQNRPALMRVQLLQYDTGKGFTLSQLNQKNDDGTINTSDNASLFLYPSTTGADVTDPTSFSDDSGPANTTGSLQEVKCDPDFSTNGGGNGAYACSVTITIPNPIGAADNTSRDAYLRVDELYNTSTNFRVTMQNGSDPITFAAVQPAVDSTGRANDLFRRVSSRIDMEASSIPNLEAGVDVTGSLCKTFLVTDNPADYDSGICQGNSSGSPSP